MNYDFDVISPPHRLAIAHAKPELRTFLSLIFEFDSRLKDTAMRATEPLIGQLKLAWWRDAIMAAPDARPAGEPLFAKLRGLEAAGQGACAAKAMINLLSAWEYLIVNQDDVMAVAEQFASDRSAGVFGGFLEVSGLSLTDQVTALGQNWALNDMGWPAEKASFHGPLRSRAYRPLTIIAKSAALQSSANSLGGLKLICHALTGR
jgi:15-cis-phytoene synthase